MAGTTDEDRSTREIISSTDDYAEYYVVIKGRHTSDTGVYETAQKVQDGVSAPSAKSAPVPEKPRSTLLRVGYLTSNNIWSRWQN